MLADMAVELLGEVNASIEADTANAVWRLIDGLQGIKRSSDAIEWRAVAHDVCRAHPLKERLDQDPFTSRSFRRPRGYPGDAELLDFIYLGLTPEQGQDTTPLGRRIFHETTYRAPAAHAVRMRRELLTSRLDQLAAAKAGARVLSVACGHLHEARCARSVKEGRIGELVALDHDPLTLARLSELGDFNVTPVRASVRDILEGKRLLERFDFVYAAGLFDYLNDRTAGSLTAQLFDALNAGGELLIGNFLPDIRGSAYMEAFMDWSLTARGEEQLMACLQGVPSDAIARSRTWRDEQECIAYLAVQRAA